MVTREPPRVPKPASKIPWYVLATIHGEQTEDGWNEEVAAKNRQNLERLVVRAPTQGEAGRVGKAGQAG